MKTPERSFQCGQGLGSLVQCVCASELLELKGRVDGGTRTEVGDRPFESMGRTLDRLGVAGGQRFVHTVQSLGIFVQEERGDLFQKVEIPANSSQRSSAIQNLFLQWSAHRSMPVVPVRSIGSLAERYDILRERARLKSE